MTQCRTLAQFSGNLQLSVFNLEFSLFNLESNKPDVVAEGCPYFLELLLWERKKKSEVGTEVGKGVKKNRKEKWPYLCRILFNSCSNLPPLRDHYVY